MENEKIKISDISFPIVAFIKGNTIYFARNEEEITTCNKSSFTSGFFNNLYIVDSAGFSYEVQEAIRVGTIGIFWGYNIFLNQKLKVKLVFKNKSNDPIDLSSFKEHIIDNFTKDQYFWNSDGDLKKRIDFVKNSNSFTQIIKHLSDDFYKKIG